MLKSIKFVVFFFVSIISAVASAAPFGGSDDLVYASQLWKSLAVAGYVGPSAIMSVPYDGQPPHGAVLDTIDGAVTVGANTGVVIVKRNYGGEGVSKSAVSNNPAKYIRAVTVMYKRKGYDADNNDWFWAKYKPDGSLHTNDKGMSLAGRVAKGMPKGCIACHTAAPGGDYVFNNDRVK
ncbi:MAG: hypothetical protein HOC23_09560 [Halieaceae bacterium]|nr:hypothetical protein [Halieaceae bacterium]